MERLQPQRRTGEEVTDETGTTYKFGKGYQVRSPRGRVATKYDITIVGVDGVESHVTRTASFVDERIRTGRRRSGRQNRPRHA